MIETSLPNLMLRQLTGPNAVELHALIQQNRAHLTAHGDFAELVATSRDGLMTALATPSALRFGVWLDDRLIGQMDLVPVDPPRYGLGYWLAETATGRGYVTAALTALVRHAGDALGATDIYAGVTHGNRRSHLLLERLGFRPIATFARYTRFHRQP